ncbi:MAG: phospholipase D family protein [Proteobacteria bacterium]|nr:phospholipase D family protein [Pseudomonadota bacterium]
MTRKICLLVALLLALPPAPALDRTDIDATLASHPGQTGTLVLERGEQALLVRAWLADNARCSIEVQYFIWSTDNIGILAAHSLLRAADRGVRVRVLVDDLLVDAPDESLRALAEHPNIDIRIYNPVHNVGVPWYKRLWGLLTNFRRANQRMHDKTLTVDGELAITGGRNMADEYFDFDHEYNFRDRDALVMGSAARMVQESFERFWTSPLSVAIETQLEGPMPAAEIAATYRRLHAHAADPRNFAPEVHQAIAAIPEDFPRLAAQLRWSEVQFLSDTPGKNDGSAGLAGGGLTTAGLARLVESAREEVLIQSPYLVLSDPAIALFRATLARGVRVRISTNSLASTDNLQAFSGYRRQREELLAMGVELREFRPHPQVEREVMQRYAALRAKSPVFALHAKTLVVDRSSVFIGTYNLDPRSENLNTEVGVIIHDAVQAQRVAASIDTDMLPENSWNPAAEDSDKAAGWTKRMKVRFWQLLPLRAVL